MAERKTVAVRQEDIKAELSRASRRGFLKRTLSLGGLAMLSGCDLSTHSGVDAALEAMLRFDDRVQAALFGSQRLARTYSAADITRPFRFNAFIPIGRCAACPTTGRSASPGEWRASSRGPCPS